MISLSINLEEGVSKVEKRLLSLNQVDASHCGFDPQSPENQVLFL